MATSPTRVPELEFGDVAGYDARDVSDSGWEVIDGGGGAMQRVMAAHPGGVDRTLLLRFPPRFTTPTAVQHGFIEEVLLLRGELTDLTLGRTFAAGEYCCRPVGMRHGPYRTGDDGCDMMVVERDSRADEEEGGGYLSIGEVLSRPWGALHALGSAMYVALGSAHLAFTVYDAFAPGGPRYFAPTAPGALDSFKASSLQLDPRINAWNAYLGFHVTHSLFVLGVGAIAAFALTRVRRARHPKDAPASASVAAARGQRSERAPGNASALLAALSLPVSILAAYAFFHIPAGGSMAATVAFATSAWLQR
uniref:ChrR-like cupin domain-containing protein n=1 Tax=Bicosoecida sp. CB-2014 TaxID=1486930 RepID=A0A7S1G6F4_9STRA|mmetsp:Transcript_18025/g.63736  ORF Transcript_18025/g.63736 Transcript_18025/m.63736 type:complete len:307 (+) Transcript_18025:179-1099(+)|eukprot:CAMPEP_0203809614 /NCGR_PEP_ID=MMETSP0115-20131106/2392_1 /ASSEMBLY_ACC=CAM_ASM_000227 /TAXON_ID=33651 /ORGANISM="Bicosoecid sp, Strain ms1" /LENGTH=306 /DNA_ID=CAMNT_0050718357 /DNA_START=158 /DNA_END=1078 /DNA_ORIENTATION=-